MKVNELASVVDDLIQVLIQQTVELKNLVRHVEQVTSHLPDERGLTVIHASLSEIHQRLGKLRGIDNSEARSSKDRFFQAGVDAHC